jgi:tRNA1Val (adenine37-N6)-methyltransferase
MLAQRCRAKIDAIDICLHSYDQAQENVSNSKWKNRITVIHSSIQNFRAKKKYDFIISNPPYYECPKTHKEKPDSHTRFTSMLCFGELLDGVIANLSGNGTFYIILPVMEGSRFVNEAEQRKLYLNSYVWVKTTANKKYPKRILMKYSYKKIFPKEKILTILDGKRFTREYKSLTRQYYRNF